MSLMCINRTPDFRNKKAALTNDSALGQAGIGVNVFRPAVYAAASGVALILASQ